MPLTYTLGPGITVVTPTIPNRPPAMLAAAIGSALRQTLQPAALAIEVDVERTGAGPTRTRAMYKVRTEWMAFLDDDDWWMDHHLRTCYDAQRETGADIVWPWFEVHGGADPFPMHRGRQWDPEIPHMHPICALVRTEFVFDHHLEFGPPGQVEGDDWPFWIAASEAGATHYHTPEITWVYRHWGYGRPGSPGNTSGQPDRW